MCYQPILFSITGSSITDFKRVIIGVDDIFYCTPCHFIASFKNLRREFVISCNIFKMVIRSTPSEKKAKRVNFLKENLYFALNSVSCKDTFHRKTFYHTKLINSFSLSKNWSLSVDYFKATQNVLNLKLTPFWWRLNDKRHSRGNDNFKELEDKKGNSFSGVGKSGFIQKK